ncbi:hypothetical protein KM043_005798 [Ampulex compressa]|nr:hypothetical protein KM043_005798 [Ampulex compressa]
MLVGPDEFSNVTKQLTTVLANCKAREMHYIGVARERQIPAILTKEFVERISTVQLEISNSRDTFASYKSGAVPHVKLHAFLIFVSSPKNLRRFLSKLRKSALWNPWAFYILVESETVETGCENAKEFLAATLNLELYSSTFLCLRKDKGAMLYTYNPYMNYAPRPWTKVDTYRNSSRNLTWTMYKKKFLPEQTSCEDLTFDKTTSLGGYTVKLLALQIPPFLSFNPKNCTLDTFGGMDGLTAQVLWRTLNVSLATTCINATDSYKFLPEVHSGHHDILMNRQWIFNKPNMSITYPHAASGINVLTRFPGYQTEYLKILNFMNPKVIVCIFLVCILTTFVLTNCIGRGACSAALEVLRMSTSTATLHQPRETSLRIYLITVIFLFAITGPSFHSNLSSLLTLPVPEKLVDTAEDLKASGYPIYTFDAYKNAIYDEVLYSRLRTIDHWDCSDYVENERSATCAAEVMSLTRVAFEKDLYLSKHSLSTLYVSYIVRPYWSLIDRVTSVLSRMTQCGLVDYWRVITVAHYKHKWEVLQKKNRKKKFEVMILEDLAFCFWILGFGLGLSSLVFVGEVLHGRFARGGRGARGSRVKRAGPIYPFTN